jgi:hypothetical protein
MRAQIVSKVIRINKKAETIIVDVTGINQSNYWKGKLKFITKKLWERKKHLLERVEIDDFRR